MKMEIGPNPTLTIAPIIPIGCHNLLLQSNQNLHLNTTAPCLNTQCVHTAAHFQIDMSPDIYLPFLGNPLAHIGRATTVVTIHNSMCYTALPRPWRTPPVAHTPP
jgi:hypothetical protein